MKIIKSWFKIYFKVKLLIKLLQSARFKSVLQYVKKQSLKLTLCWLSISTLSIIKVLITLSTSTLSTYK